VRAAFGAAFLRAERFTALRSDLSVMDFVFAMSSVFFLISNVLRMCVGVDLEPFELCELLH